MPTELPVQQRRCGSSGSVLFINRAVEHYISTQRAESVQKQLEAALIRDADIDREVNADGAVVDNERWQHSEAELTRKPATRSAAKSTSRRSTRP